MSNVKPELTDVVANITALGSIETNISLIKDRALSIKSFYENLVIAEDDVKDMKAEMAALNKTKDVVKKYRIDIVKEFNKPLDEFVANAKETEKLLSEAYDSLKSQVKVFEDARLEERKAEVIDYFNEYAKSLDIEFVPFENSGITVGLSGSMKSYKEACKNFLDRIDSDLKLISSQDEDIINEILVEYKKSLNVGNAIITVKERKRALELEKERQEALNALKAKEEEVIKKVEEVTAPKEVVEPKKYTARFKVTTTLDQLKDLKKYMDLKGINYESIS